jgi:hypothetical protein
LIQSFNKMLTIVYFSASLKILIYCIEVLTSFFLYLYLIMLSGNIEGHKVA